jgi:predicted phage-related endonuclease
MNTFTVPKPPHGSAEWLAVRWKNKDGLSRISASNAAAVHGEHKYLTPARLAAELLQAEAPLPQEVNRAMQRGNTLEEPIRIWAGQLLGTVLTVPCVMYCFEDAAVRLIATIDAIGEAGEVCEIKTMRGRWNGQLPRMWYWQGVQQAICCGRDSITWVIFDSDLDLQFCVQRVTSDEKQIHLDKCREFLAAIDMGMVPDWIVTTFEDLQIMHPTGNNTSVELDRRSAGLVSTYLEHMRVAEQFEQKAKEAKARLCELLGDAEFGTVDGEVVVTWRTTTRSMFDTKKFEADHPALAAKYKKKTTFRTFRAVDNQGEEQ